MKTVSVNIPETLIEGIQNLINEGQFANRGEAIRAFTREGIIKEHERIEMIHREHERLKEEKKEVILSDVRTNSERMGLDTKGTP